VKVLFLNPIGALGGAEHVLLDLIASQRSGSPELEMEVLALVDGPLLSEAAALGASTDVLPLPHALRAFGESGTHSEMDPRWLRSVRATAALGAWLPRLAVLLRQKRANILHSNGLKTHLLGALARPRGVPLIWHLHDFVSGRRVTSGLLPLLQRRATLGIAVSEAVSRDAHTVLRRLRIDTVLSGIRTELFAPGRASPVDLDSLCGLGPAPSGTVRIGLVATYASWKGHRLFLEAARRAACPNARFYMIGGPIYSTAGSQVTEVELRDSVARLGLGAQCGLVPFQRDVPAVYAALDIVVQTSTRPEPFGRTVTEAMASGKVVVAFGAGGVLEQLDDTTGVIVPPSDVDALARSISELAKDAARRGAIGRRARMAATEKLDSRRLGEALRSTYVRLTNA
jgi:glycosyltransferase involved in cell wall biosynthesis